MGHNLDEVVVKLSRVFCRVLELIVDFSVFLEHIEHGVAAVVHVTEHLLDASLLFLCAKGQRVHHMVYLQLVLADPLLLVVFLKLLEGATVASKQEGKLACDLAHVNRAEHLAHIAIFKEVFYQV